MDPISALSAASSVVQFVDFAGKLVSGSYRIYKSASGEFDRNAEIKTITNKLVGLNQGLRKSSEANSPSKQCSQNDQDLYILCKDCNTVATDLINALQKLQGHPQSVWGSFQLALRTMWTEEEVDSLHRRVDAFRQQISMQILVTLREQVVTLGQRQVSDHARISHSLVELHSKNDQILRDLDRSMKWKEDVVDAIYRSYNQNSRPECATVKDVSLEDRHERIAEAHKKTFQWVFQKQRNDTGSSFVKWLQDDGQLYWVTGKAGAGKSTLMKYIYSEPRTCSALRRWAGSKPLIRASFFFWNSGTNMQMPQEGLLRTLLHDILQQCPHLVPVVFPQRLEAFVLLPIEKRLPWKWSELLKAFRALLEELGKIKKIALFIDGLDEFDGDHKELVVLIRSILNPNTKVCVASRPWVAFEDAFKHGPNLTLEELTYSDIKEYITSELSGNPGFTTLRTLEPTYAGTLIENITLKASGVFLWVFLVVRSLLEGLSNGEILSDLQSRLDSLPADLENLFWGIIHQLDAFHFERGMQLFQLVREAIVPLTVLELSYADEDCMEYALNLDIGPVSEAKKAARAEMMRRRLNACTKGLLEAAPSTALQSQKTHAPGFKQPEPRLPVVDSLVGYLHRTVRDFMQQHDTSMRVHAQTNEAFNVNQRLCCSYITQLKTLDMAACKETQVCEVITYGIEYAVRADPDDVSMQCWLLEEIDHSADRQVRNPAARFLKTLVNRSDYILMDQSQKAQSICHWAATLPDFRNCISFLQFATQCQLVNYVKVQLANDPLALKQQDSLPLLYYAIYTYRVLPTARDRPVCSHTSPNAKLVSLLLDNGADPDFKVDQQTIRQIATEKSQRSIDDEWQKILILFDQVKSEPEKKRRTARGSKIFKYFARGWPK